MRILGIDPGSRKAGWAVIETEGKKIKYIASGVLNFEKIKDLVDRLGVASKACEELNSLYQPDVLSLESLIYVKNVTSLAKLAQARGAMIAGFGEDFKGKIFEYSPNLIKSSVTGHGHASKEGIEKTLNMIFGDIKFSTSDESDALAIALCHALNLGKNKTPNRSKTKSRSLKQAFSHLQNK